MAMRRQRPALASVHPKCGRATSAGISVISQEAPMFQDLAKVSAITAAGMLGVVSFGNALGRVFWAWLSDIVTRRMTFVIMYLLQVALFWLLPSLHATTVRLFRF